MNSNVFFCPKSQASEEKENMVHWKNILEARKGELWKRKYGLLEIIKTSFPQLTKWERNILSVAVKFLGRTIRKLGKTREKGVVWYGKSLSEQSVVPQKYQCLEYGWYRKSGLLGIAKVPQWMEGWMARHASWWCPRKYKILEPCRILFCEFVVSGKMT